MKSLKMCILLVSMTGFFLLVGCNEAKEAADGADKITDQVIGLTPLTKKKKMEDMIKKANEEQNKKIQDELDKN